MTVYYENDKPDATDHPNAGMIQSISRVRDHFKEKIDVKFIVGALVSVNTPK